MASSPVVCLLTDFGLSDHYVGAMKAVLLKDSPGLSIVDLTHNIPAQDIQAGAFQLLASYAYYPQGTLFLCVVDPGVGSERKILYAEAGGYRFVGPDNGLLSWVFAKEEPSLIVAIEAKKISSNPVSQTFHGRDIMAPAVARLTQGMKPQDLGPARSSWVQLPFPKVKKLGAVWTGEVIAMDSFGNVITNFSSEELKSFSSAAKLWFEIPGVADTLRHLSTSYKDVPVGKFLAIVGCSGFIEIAINSGSAAQKTGLKVGDPISVRFRT